MAFDRPDIRPRTLGEILDDAWRLYRVEPALVLALAGVFLVPAMVLGLIHLALPAAPFTGARLLTTALLALLLPLTGLGAGALQELYYSWAEGARPQLGQCLRAAWRRGLHHVTAQALLLVLPTLGFSCLLIGGDHVVLWCFCGAALLLAHAPLALLGLTWHAALTGGQKDIWKAARYAWRAGWRASATAWLLLLSQTVALVLIAANLHLAARSSLWALEEVAGLDVTALKLMLVLANPLYLLVLGMLTWWLLAPYHEAVRFLFFIDGRARYEGLDLWYRIEEQFAIRTAKQLGVLVLLTGALLAGAGPAHAVERLAEIQHARRQVQAIAVEVKAAEPYPGGRHWRLQLARVRAGLARAEPQRYRWLEELVDAFGKGDRTRDLELLAQLEQRLSLLEATLARAPAVAQQTQQRSAEDIRKLLASLHGEAPPLPPLPKKATEPREKPPPQELDNPQPRDFGRAAPAGPPLVAPVAVGQLGVVLLWLVVGVLILLLVVGLGLIAWKMWTTRRKSPVKKQGKLTPALDPALALEPEKVEVPSLWRQAQELADQGRYLDAVRTLYLTALTLLHQQHWIRYERTRTNGEYADQLRKQPALREVFLQLTGIFELKWYGERSCALGDFQACHALAERLQELARLPQTTAA